MTNTSLPAEFDEWIATRNFRALRPYLKSAEPADIAEKLAGLSRHERIVIFRLVTRTQRAEVFAYLPLECQEELIEGLPESVVTGLLNEMEPDDRTRFLEELPFEIRSQLLLRLSPEERSKAWQLLSYEEDSVGRLMNPEFIAVRAEMKVSEAFAFVRWTVREPEELESHLFVVDADGRYLGEVGLANLVLADPPTRTLDQIMDIATVSLVTTDDKSKAVDAFRKYDRFHIAVVNDDNVLVGVLTSDDVFDIAEDEATEEIQQFGGQATLEDSYFQTPALTLLRKRAGWLAVLFIGELFTGTALRHYDEAIAQMRYLVYFVPLVISSGGNSGSQAASLIIRGLAVKEMVIKDWWRVFSRELLMGVALGAMLGVIGYLRAWTWGEHMLTCLIVGFSLVGIVLWGTLAGSILPFVIKACRLDPAVSSSPLIASLVDVSGIIIYFTVASQFVTYLGPIIGVPAGR
jgi:magnesium transporter